tara:strand:- start:496 stop:732 length:237 start_codon:yes stop_codon:yes gene_type:complete
MTASDMFMAHIQACELECEAADDSADVSVMDSADKALSDAWNDYDSARRAESKIRKEAKGVYLSGHGLFLPPTLEELV